MFYERRIFIHLFSAHLYYTRDLNLIPEASEHKDTLVEVPTHHRAQTHTHSHITDYLEILISV